MPKETPPAWMIEQLRKEEERRREEKRPRLELPVEMPRVPTREADDVVEDGDAVVISMI